ncbi:MAG: VWA domain-containing protein [Myxococcales bacterium]|nr:VWA domain-containing protein [Myxococcales bacterium]
MITYAKRSLLPLAVAALLLGACTDTGDFTGTDGDAGGFTEAGTKCDPTEDTDGDGILNGEEGCTAQRDSDNDGTPDWQDFDSDNDGIPDEVEAGAKDANGKCAKTGGPWPCDTDKDGYPDYVDVDSDGDGIDDGDEDANGDGKLGCCLTKCGQPEGKQAADCILTKDGCGPGQKCENGNCTPAVGFSCSNGETDPLKKDTFGDGKLDSERGTFICRDATEDKPQGRKSIQTQQNQQGDWHVAVEKSAKYGDLKLTNPGPKEAAAAINEEDPKNEVAGFVISMDTTEPDVQKSLDAIIQALQGKVPGGSGTITVRASGAKAKTHDGYASVRGTILDLEVSTPSNISTVRNELIGTVMNKPMAQLGNLPSPFGSSHSNFIIRFVTVRRFAFKKDSTGKKELDANGDPIDDGNKGAWRLIVMGAVAGRDNYQDPARPTGFIVDDLSNGTALATHKDTVDNECDVGTITSLPVADIVWVIDESGSMSDNRQDIVNNANNFFSRALASGLDFRMAVTNVVAPSGSNQSAIGHFCSKISTNTSDDGGTDRFLLATEQATFSSCINNPPGYEGGSEYMLTNAEEAMKKHLPRAVGDQSKFRVGASIAYIIATDEADQSLKSGILTYTDYASTNCNLDAAKQGQVTSAIQKYIDLFSGKTDPEAVATVHLIGGVCNNSCGAEMPHGQRLVAQALSGQIGDVCQKDLGNTLQVIIDSIIGAASPVVLEYVPISASLAVALDGIQINRSRTNGFDYRGANNSIALINVQFEKGSELIASYKRWAEQAIIE